MKFGTKAIHAGIEPDPHTGAIMTPVYLTSTYVQSSPGVHKGYDYSRTGNPTREVLENNIAALENGRFGLCFSSGMAASDTVVKLLKPGDEIIAVNDLYGGMYRMLTKVFADFGIRSHFVAMDDPVNLKKHISSNTKMIWVETPTNPLMNIIDIKAVSEIAKENGLILCVDNTFATPYLQTPLDLGADIVVHSATKYLGGHSDLLMGMAITNDEKLAERLQFIQKSCGAVSSPFDCFMMLRSIKTLHIRIEKHCQNGRIIAQYLTDHPKIDTVYWPGLPSHPNHEIAKKQMKDFGGMISFTLKGDRVEDAVKTMERFKLFALAESLGGVESLVGHPATMTHASIPKEEREKNGLKDSLIRLSIGIEDVEDLLEDLKYAIG